MEVVEENAEVVDDDSDGSEETDDILSGALFAVCWSC